MNYVKSKDFKVIVLFLDGGKRLHPCTSVIKMTYKRKIHSLALVTFSFNPKKLHLNLTASKMNKKYTFVCK